MTGNNAMHSFYPLLVIGLLHLNKGIYSQNNGCRPGFAGSSCNIAVMNVIGSITCKIDGNQSNFNENLFKTKLFSIFPSYVNVTVSVINHSRSSRVGFVVTTVLPEHFTTVNVTKYQKDLSVKLMEHNTTVAAFPNSTSIVASSATADVDECSSASLHSCRKNQVCFNKDDGFGCSCRVGYANVNDSCIEIFCMLHNAPPLPGLATRTIRFENGSDVPALASSGRLPFKTHIVYTCPNRFTLVNSASGSTQVDVIECVGATATTHGNSGWSGGGSVRCAMTLQYQIAIIMAAISSAIIVLMSGAFIVSCTKKDKQKESDTVHLGVNTVGMEHSL